MGGLRPALWTLFGSVASRGRQTQSANETQPRSHTGKQNRGRKSTTNSEGNLRSNVAPTKYSACRKPLIPGADADLATNTAQKRSSDGNFAARELTRRRTVGGNKTCRPPVHALPFTGCGVTT